MENPKGIAAIPILIIAVIVAALLAGGSWLYARDSKCRGKQCTVQPVITNFSDCVNIGYPATQTYPRQCTAYGVTYTETVANSNRTSNQNTNTAVEQTSYLACGCGCCPDATPAKQCLYKSKGDSLATIQQQDMLASQNPQCATVGCSLGTLYQYCDTEATNANSSVSTAGWKTYTNTELGITFKYPQAWDTVTLTNQDNTQNNANDKFFSGKAKIISFSNISTRTWIQFSSADYKTMYGAGYYVGGKDLSDECKFDGRISGENFCYTRIVSTQKTSDRVYFESPECSPRFVRVVYMNTQNNQYPGLAVSQDFSSKASCIASSAEWDATVQSELKSILSRSISSVDKARMEEFDTLLTTVKLTK